MTPTPLSKLDDVNAWCWRQLVRGAADPKSALHWPVVCTNGDHPAGRVMVLRRTDAETRTLELYTDRRSAKIAEIEASNEIECVFFDQKRGLQIRVRGTAHLVVGHGPATERLRSIPEHRRQDYETVPGPGHPIDAADAFQHLTGSADKSFCLIVVKVTKLDWLQLSPSGHRRASIEWHQDKVALTWLVP